MVDFSVCPKFLPSKNIIGLFFFCPLLYRVSCIFTEVPIMIGFVPIMIWYDRTYCSNPRILSTFFDSSYIEGEPAASRTTSGILLLCPCRTYLALPCRLNTKSTKSTTPNKVGHNKSNESSTAFVPQQNAQWYYKLQHI